MTDALIEIAGGTLRGHDENGVLTFLGIRYGEDTASRRFLPALPAVPWDGVRDALTFPPQCLQPPTPDFELLRSGWDHPSESSEDCLFLNLWTPACDGAPRPVMVNLHGGSWTVGSGNSAGRSGEAFARNQDVVRINVNHRLGVFGFSQVEGLLGPGYAGSGTIGILDVVLALEWVRDNIGAFGGDPGNVTIFGVSGGGQKVATLMAMPSAKGLFHRASIESGPMLTARAPTEAAEAASRLFASLNIEPERATDILKLNGEEILAGFLSMYPDGGLLTSGIRPVVDGVNLLHHPFEPSAPEESNHVPLLIGTTATETSIFPELFGGYPFDIGWDEVPGKLAPLLPAGSDAIALVERARAALPNASPVELLFSVSTEAGMRVLSRNMAERATSRPAPVFVWLLEWVTPVDGGKWGSPHGLSVPLVMDTVANVSAMFGPDLSEPLALSRTMSSAWAAFARTGVPASPGLAEWPPFDPIERWTMVFDNHSRVETDPQPMLRQLFQSPLRLPTTVFGTSAGLARPTR